MEIMWRSNTPGATALDPQRRPNESVTCSRVMSEGHPRGNGDGPLTHPTRLNREGADASMHTPNRATHPASTPSQHRPPTEPVLLGDCLPAVLAAMAARDEESFHSFNTLRNESVDTYLNNAPEMED